MAIQPIGPQLPTPPTLRLDLAESSTAAPRLTSTGGAGEAANSFAQLFNNAVSQIDGLQKVSDANRIKLATGEPVDMHDVVLSAEQANLSFQLGLQIRNKLLEAYQEVMRMPV
jgi:flagellar hook-basal body complex protein FliE